MKRSRKITTALAVVIAGGMFYGTQPADAGILSKLGLKVDEINITLKGKNSRSNQQTPPPPQQHYEAQRPEPPREHYEEPHSRKVIKEVEVVRYYEDDRRPPRRR